MHVSISYVLLCAALFPLLLLSFILRSLLHLFVSLFLSFVISSCFVCFIVSLFLCLFGLLLLLFVLFVLDSWLYYFFICASVVSSLRIVLFFALYVALSAMCYRCALRFSTHKQTNKQTNKHKTLHTELIIMTRLRQEHNYLCVCLLKSTNGRPNTKLWSVCLFVFLSASVGSVSHIATLFECFVIMFVSVCDSLEDAHINMESIYEQHGHLL